MTTADNDDAPAQMYYEELRTLIQQLSVSKNTNTSSSSTTEQREALYQQAQDCWQQLSLEVRSLRDKDSKAEWTAILQGCKSQLDAHRLELDRRALLGDGSSTTSSAAQVSMSQPEAQLYQNESHIQRQNDALERAHRSVQETEQVALGITDELSQNRSKLQSAHQRVGELSSLTERADSLLKSMSKKFWR